MKDDSERHGVCALCGFPELLQASHIVPKFHKRRQRSAASERGGIVAIKEGKSRTDPNPGGRSEHLLCRECKQKIGKWETYAANWFYNFTPAISLITSDGTIYGHIKYPEFRLYCLSVLWRMSASSLQYYSDVKLPNDHENLIGEALRQADTLDQCYAVGLSRITSIDGSDFAASIPPYKLEVDGRLSFHLLANGFMHDFWIAGYEAAPEISASVLRPEGTLSVPNFTYEEHPYVSMVMRHNLDKHRDRS